MALAPLVLARTAVALAVALRRPPPATEGPVGIAATLEECFFLPPLLDFSLFAMAAVPHKQGDAEARKLLRGGSWGHRPGGTSPLQP